MANKRAQKNILDILFEKGVLKSEAAFALKKEAEEKEKTYEEILYEKNAAPEKDILEAKSVLLKVPAKSLAGEKISLEILKEVSEEAAKHYGFIPISKTGNILEVGVINPEDVTLQESLKFIALRGNLTVKQYLISKTDFEDVLKQYRSLGGEVTEELEKLKPEEELAAAPKGAVEKMAEEAARPKVVGVIIKHAVEGRASDSHIEQVSKNLRVRFRMDGVLYTSLLLPLDVHQAIVSRIKILSNLKIDETRVPQDGRFHTKFENKEIDFRVSTFPTAFGEKVVMRILDPAVG
ncbi:MAG: ATPase, T2SS/T4P/T4SS family, partial [Patescibacteria group bacterium]